MTESLVPTVRTSPTMRDFARALLLVWPEATKAAAGILWAQFAGETGDGKHCYGWNLGNVKWFKGCGNDYQALKGVFEYVNGKRVEVPSSSPAAWFQVFPSLAAGMGAFVLHKQRPGYRYSSAWTFVLAGDCDGYARELGRKGYYTISQDIYAQSMISKHAVWMRDPAFEDALHELASAPLGEESDHDVAAKGQGTLDSPVVDFAIVHPAVEFTGLHVSSDGVVSEYGFEDE